MNGQENGDRTEESAQGEGGGQDLESWLKMLEKSHQVFYRVFVALSR